MIRALLLTILASGTAVSQATSTKAPELTVSVMPLKRVYSLGEKIRVRYEIENVGETPFYVPKGIDTISDAHGCMILNVGTRYGGEGIVERHYADYATSYWENRDINEEIRTNWLLLKPGQFYGMTVTLKFTPLKAGHYWIVAEHASGHVSDREKLLLADLKFPILLGTHSSKAARIEVIERSRRKR